MSRIRSTFMLITLFWLIVIALMLQPSAARSQSLDASAEPSLPVPLAEEARVREMIADLQTEGLDKMNVAEYHQQGIKGAGVNIAILDVGYAGLDSRISEGELPADVARFHYDGDEGQLRPGFGDDPSSHACEKPQVHGTAVAEIVHDIAPEARLYLIRVYDTNAPNLRPLFEGLENMGVHVVSASLSWGIWRGNGTGPGYDLFEDVRHDLNMLFIESGGNAGMTTYQATFQDDDNDGKHEFRSGFVGIGRDETNDLKLDPCTGIGGVLTWDDWGNDPGNPDTLHDYDLVLYDKDENEVARSERIAGSLQAPREDFSYFHSGTEEFEGRLVVERASTDISTRGIRLQVWNIYSLQYYQSDNSLSSYGDSTYVFSVGAADIQTSGIEPYSSRGPTTDGRTKPNITGYARVRTASYGYNRGLGFPGTSAAAPHVSGAAALLLQVNPGLTADQLAQRLVDAAEPKGPGNEWGAGLVRLPPLALNLAILAPTTAAPDYVGDPGAPVKTLIDVAVTTSAGTQWAGLGAADFSVQVGGRLATVTTVRKIEDRYLVEIVPPTQDAAGIYDLVVSAHGQSATQPAALRYATAGSNRVDVMLILDRSGSMAGQPLRDARNAAVLFVDLMTLGDAIGVGSYSTSSHVDYPLTPITDPAIKTAASNAILAISDGGYTSIGAGLVTGRDQLLSRGDDNHPWAIVLLSDGQENTAPYVDTVLPTITATKIKVFSIGLGTVDESLMSRIAAETGGSYYLTPDSTELARIYNSIAGQVAGRQTLFTVDGSINAGQTAQHNVLVDPSVTEAIFSVSWDDASDDLNLTLTQPDGRRIDAAVAASDPNIDFVSGATYEYFLVRAPQSGNWLIDVAGIRTAFTSESADSPDAVSANEAYTLSIQGTTQLTLEATTDSAQYRAGDPIQVLVSLADSNPLPDAQVRATLSLPNGETENLELLDDGNHNDNGAGDGVYGALYHRTHLVGTYRLDMTATGQSSGQPFVRQMELSVVVTQATDADGDGMPDEWEYWSGLDPLRNDSNEDPDSDDLTNLNEYRNGAEPWFPDTDVDGLLDGQEVNDYHSNPRQADTDLGGVNDGEEVEQGTDPLNPADDNDSNVRSGTLFLPISLQIPYVPPALPLLNGNFEAGPANWTQSSTHNWPLIVNSDAVEDLPTHSGIWIAWLGGDDNETSTIEQTVTVPTDRPYLTYYYGIASKDACGYDFGRVLVNGAVVEQYTLCRNNNTPDWAYRVVNLSAYAGQTVTLQFRATTDGSLNSNLLIDDVAFNNATTGRAAPVPFRWPAEISR